MRDQYDTLEEFLAEHGCKTIRELEGVTEKWGTDGMFAEEPNEQDVQTGVQLILGQHVGNATFVARFRFPLKRAEYEAAMAHIQEQVEDEVAEIGFY